MSDLLLICSITASTFHIPQSLDFSLLKSHIFASFHSMLPKFFDYLYFIQHKNLQVKNTVQNLLHNFCFSYKFAMFISRTAEFKGSNIYCNFFPRRLLKMLALSRFICQNPTLQS